MSIESVMPSNHLILYRPLLLLPSIFPSIRVFPNESALCIRWPKYWSFRFSISPSNEHPGLISFRMDWLDFLAVQGTLKCLLQHHSSKASILWCSAFFIVQLSHPCMTTGKTIALTRWTFVGKVRSLLLNMLSRLVITFLPRSKHLLISWLQSPSAVILEPRKIKSDTVSTFSPSISHEVMRTPAVQTTHFQFHPHPVDLVLTYRKGLNTGLTPGQMPLARKQPGQGPPKSLPLTWQKTTDLKWHLHIQSSSCINVNLMSANKWYQSATTTRCSRALPALCKCASLASLSPETAFLGDSFHCRVLENITHRVEGGGTRQSITTTSNLQKKTI